MPENEKAVIDEGGEEISDEFEGIRIAYLTTTKKEKAVIDKGGEEISDEFEGIRIA
ncbi:hypothetical protein TIFTF001_038895 [Ficus carica]|uniref:Uncharacterized protein n=1 Tax=Ficus carica TaxID=3494 RepID=A0AA88E836_FICCA|nr:hypothetical protein TIFTF001_038895 [Ficus carica]